MNCILVCAGTAGDVYPFIGLGRGLLRRGHRVAVLTFESFAGAVRAAGLGYAHLPGPVRGDERTRAARELRGGYRSAVQRAVARVVAGAGGRWKRLARASSLLPLVRPVYEGIRRLHEPGGTVVVAHAHALGARVARDALGVPLAQVYLSPAWLRSACRAPVLPPLRLPDQMPGWCKRLAYRAADAVVYDPLVAAPLNDFRRGLGLPPVYRPYAGWVHSPDLVLGLFPEWFAPPQPDWPAVRLLGFPGQIAGEGEVPPAVEEFLAAGPPPVLVTPSSEARRNREFFAAAVAACRAAGRRALLVTRFADQVPAGLPEGVLHADYVPFGRALPRSAAVVYFGGIGTAARALAAGVPHMVVPMRNDQFDNAERLRRLGVARVLPHASCRAGRLVGPLGELLGSPEVARRCREWAGRLGGGESLEAACDAIEGLRAGRLAA